MRYNKIGFLGVGNMASALLKGMLQSGDIKPDYINIYDPSGDRMAKFSTYGVRACQSNKDVADNSQYIFLCVKPQVCPEVLQSLQEVDWREKVVVSICAGVTIATIKKYIGNQASVIRAMPNTPLLLGEGMTALACPPDVDTNSFQDIRALFAASGKTVEVDELEISAVTAVSGSGPAYCFKLARAVIEEGIALGLSRETASELFFQTMRGSAAMLAESGKSPSELIDMVTSPKGTTLAASEIFDQNGFEPTTRKAVRACYDRAEELAGNR